MDEFVTGVPTTSLWSQEAIRAQSCYTWVSTMIGTFVASWGTTSPWMFVTLVALAMLMLVRPDIYRHPQWSRVVYAPGVVLSAMFVWNVLVCQRYGSFWKNLTTHVCTFIYHILFSVIVAWPLLLLWVTFVCLVAFWNERDLDSDDFIIVIIALISYECIFMCLLMATN